MITSLLPGAVTANTTPGQFMLFMHFSIALSSSAVFFTAEADPHETAIPDVSTRIKKSAAHLLNCFISYLPGLADRSVSSAC